MSKKKPNEFQTLPVSTHPLEAVPKPTNQPPPLRFSENRKTPNHLKCPTCFNGRGGIGKQKWWKRVSGVSTRQCYVCNMCGFEWTATIKRMPIEIEHMEVEVDQNDGPDLETR